MTRPVFDDTVDDKLSYARAAVVFDAPYFASIVYGFVYVPIEGISTMGVTRKMVLGYDPSWVKVATIPELAADIVHEVNHFMRKHFDRGENIEDPKLFNTAGDLAINQDLRNTGIWKLADKNSARPAIFPEDYKLPEGLSTEEYYDRLLQMKQNGTLKEPSPNGGICSGHCGSIAGGTDDPKFGDALDAKEGRTAVEIQSITKRAAADIKAHVEAKGRGSVPGGLMEFAKALIEEPHVRWQNELAHVIRNSSGRIQAGGEDFSMSRPSRRSVIRGIVRPGMIEHQPEIAIIRDSSGSMNEQQLNACIREAYHIMHALGVDEAWFADADADVAMPWKRVGPQFFRNLTEVHGRGGTSFKPAIAAADKLFPRPDMLIYCTDGDGDAPRHPPQDMVIVWALIMGGYCGRPRAPARWGHTVIVSEDPKLRKATILLPDEETDADDTDDDDDA